MVCLRNICINTLLKGDKVDDNNHNKQLTLYDHVPKPVKTSQQVQTYRTILNNKPDIMIHDNKKGTCMIIDFTISGDRNVIKKEAEKVLKYTDLIIEIQCMWNVKAKVIPVIIEATGTISKSLRQYPRNIPGKHEIKKVQKKKKHIGYCTHSMESANAKYKTYFMVK